MRTRHKWTSGLALALAVGGAGCSSNEMMDMSGKPDLSVAPDLSVPQDLAAGPDLTPPDLATPPDLVTPPDLTEYPAPTITSVMPATVPTFGGGNVHIYGSNFVYATRVFLDGVEVAIHPSVQGPGELIVNVPTRPGQPGPVSVTVENPVNHKATLDKAFAYQATLIMSSVGPTQALPADPNIPTLTLADFDKDGTEDVAMSLVTPDARILVYYGKAGGTFKAPVTLTDPSTPFSMAAADLDQDGYPDLVTVNVDTNQLSIRLNDKSGGFKAPTPITFGALYPQYLTISDVDGDGKQDLVVSVYKSPLMIYKGKGDGSFMTPQSFPVSDSYPGPLVAGRFRGNSLPDIAMTDDVAYSLQLVPNTGNGSFGTDVPLATPNELYLKLLAADLDADGKDDLIAVNNGGMNAFRVYPGGANGFTTSAAYGGIDAMGALALGDFDRDGLVDVVLPDGNAGKISIFNGQTGGTFVQGMKFDAALGVSGLFVSDVNKDGTPDVIWVAGSLLNPPTSAMLGVTLITIK